VVIRVDLADDLRGWLADRLLEHQAEARREGVSAPARLPADLPIFTVPDKLIKIFDRDLKAAGIPKRDERGRTLDVHALRTTFGTLLSKGGVSLRTAQAAMRHSDPSLTANVYTDPKPLDVSGALDASPTLPLDRKGAPESFRATGTGTCDANLVALLVAETTANGGQTVASDGNEEAEPPSLFGEARLASSADSGKGNDELATPDSALQEWAMQDSNLRPPACRAGRDAWCNLFIYKDLGGYSSKWMSPKNFSIFRYFLMDY
jgi:hypothetical protein